MKAVSEINDIEQLTEQFIVQFGLDSHRDLKRVGEYQSLEDEALKRKIYDRARYKLRKENLKLVPEANTLETKAEKIQAKTKRTIEKRIMALKLFLLPMIFVFLATESIRFYEQFEVVPFFKYAIPIIIELSIFLLSLKNGLSSKILLLGLVVFNAATFTYKTIENDKSIRQEKINAAQKIKFLTQEKASIDLQIVNEEHDLKLMKMRFEDLVSKNYFKAANATYGASIDAKITGLKNLRDLSTKNGREILKIGEVRSSEYFIGIDTVFMIALKVILQLIFLFLILDLKPFYQREF